MKKLFLLALLSPLFSIAQPVLKYEQSQTLTYDEVVTEYQKLCRKFPGLCRLDSMGHGDNGKTIYAFVIADYDTASRELPTLLINNAIHPGESDGVDASLLFAYQVLSQPGLYPGVRFVIIPMYNVDGFSLQSCCTRANQHGPENQGFRGNARNLDLNRDFIKADAANTWAFYKIFHTYRPHIFIDNHVSNGADYPYTMTLITSQVDKLGGELGAFVKNEMEPWIYMDMVKKKQPMVPYVNTLTEVPDSGLVGFLETPRFSTGYAALFHCIGFVPETHMLKPYASRVKATLQLLESFALYASTHANKLVAVKNKAVRANCNQSGFPLNWLLDKTRVDSIDFNGFTSGYKASEISGHNRLWYDRNRPFTKKIPFLNKYTASDSVTRPKAYIVPQAWHEVINRLAANRIEYTTLAKDTLLNVEAYYLSNYETTKRPYEGHYLHYNTQFERRDIRKQFFKGDVLVTTDQPSVRFLIESLEPKSVDSYFNWNFFDSMLQQKEYFSDYVFEDTGARLLKTDPELKRRLEEKRKTDPDFAKNGSAQLDFIYRNSPYYESTHNQYPIFRLP